jgi:hypothetical protein
MKRSQLMLTTVVTTLVLVITSLVSAQYNPQLGRFHQRDPLGTGPRVEFSGTGSPYFVGTTGPKAPDPAYTVRRPRVQRSSSPSRLVRMNETKPVGRIVPGNSKSDSTTQIKRNLDIQYPDASINTSSGIDPMSQYQDSMNLYEYVKSNPVKYVDPYGLRSCEINIYQTPYCSFGDPGHTWFSWEGGTADLPPDYINGPTHRCQKDLKYIEAAWHTKTTKGGQLWHKDPKKRNTCSCASCDDITKCLRNYMAAKSGDFHWHVLPGPGYNCRDFVKDAMKKCCLKRGSQWLWDPLAPITFCFSECGGKK